jgi:hypothetical protein
MSQRTVRLVSSVPEKEESSMATSYIHPALTELPAHTALSLKALGRLAEPIEIASVVSYLLSDAHHRMPPAAECTEHK